MIGISFVESGARTIFNDNIHPVFDSDYVDSKNEFTLYHQIFPFGFENLVFEFKMNTLTWVGVQEGSDIDVKRVHIP